MGLLQKVVQLLTEAAYKPGVMSLVGIRRERECAADLKAYFAQLWKEINAIGLGGIARAQHKEAAIQSAELEIRRALRQANPFLLKVLSGHIYLALLDGDKVARRQMKAEFKEASPVPPTPPPEPPSLFQTIMRTVDMIGITGHEAADYAASRAASQVKGINDTTLSILRGSIQQGIEDQLGVDGLGRLIRQDFEDMSVRRAKTIASTEMNDAFSEASIRNMHRLGVEYKQLIIAPGACEICFSIEAAGPVPVDEPFVSDEGEEFDRTPIHPNCRCATVGARPPVEQ